MNCPNCNSGNIKKNGHIHNGKQNYRCKDCFRQFVNNPEKKTVSDFEKNIILKLLIERIPLRGICRVMNVSLTWLLLFFRRVTDEIPKDSGIINPVKGRLIPEMDEMWSFAGKKKKQKWIWLAIDRESGLIAGFHAGNLTRNDAKKLWKSLPGVYRQCAVCYSGFWEAYRKVIPESRHRAAGKETGQTNHIERFNCTLRQRVSRLVRKALSFSKNEDSHIRSIRYFIWKFNSALLV
ncbi:MAG: IS1 family transposase [Desulfococcaceae bacterium]